MEREPELKLKWEAGMTLILEVNKAPVTKNKTPNDRLMLVVNRDMKI